MFSGKQNLIFLAIAILSIAGLIWYVYFFKSEGAADITLPDNFDIFEESPLPSPTAVIFLPKETPRPLSKSETPEPFVGLNGIKSPAACQVYGEIEFTGKDSFVSKESKISWQNIDSHGRLINWRVSPKDDLKIGPNIFANLDIPEGQYSNLTVHLPENPIAKSYLLTTSVTYGQIVQGDVKVMEINCAGQVKVNLNFSD